MPSKFKPSNHGSKFKLAQQADSLFQEMSGLSARLGCGEMRISVELPEPSDPEVSATNGHSNNVTAKAKQQDCPRAAAANAGPTRFLNPGP